MSRTIVEGNQWVYHPENGAKLIWLNELPSFLRDGWYCTPDDFPKVSIKSGEPEEVEQEPAMDKSEVYAYGKELGVPLVWKTTKDTMVSQIEEHLNGNR